MLVSTVPPSGSEPARFSGCWNTKAASLEVCCKGIELECTCRGGILIVPIPLRHPLTVSSWDPQKVEQERTKAGTRSDYPLQMQGSAIKCKSLQARVCYTVFLLDKLQLRKSASVN